MINTLQKDYQKELENVKKEFKGYQHLPPEYHAEIQRGRKASLLSDVNPFT